MLVRPTPHFHLQVLHEESFCRVSPPSGVELNKPTHFTVSTKGAGKANLDCSFSGPTKAEAAKDVEIINNHDNTHTVKYTPVQQVRTSITRPDGAAASTLLSWRVGLTLTLTLSWDLSCPQGPLGVAVTYGGDHVPKSPFSIAVAPTLDLSKISVAGLADSGWTGRQLLFSCQQDLLILSSAPD